MTCFKFNKDPLNDEIKDAKIHKKKISRSFTANLIMHCASFIILMEMNKW